MADFKCLFFSRSYTKLYEACRAVEALLFPLKYTGVFVPVLPMCQEEFWEFPAAPTPYIIGVHASFRRLVEQMHADSLHECVKVDLDGAAVQVPACIEEASAGLTASHGLPHHLYEATLGLLYSILKPDVLHADELTEFCQLRADSFLPLAAQPATTAVAESTASSSSSSTSSSASSTNPPTTATPSCCNDSSQANSANTSLHDLPAATASLNGSSSHLAQTSNGPNSNSSIQTVTDLEAIWTDKLLRAVFVRLFAQLFAGYRYCLLIIRINPKPVIGFNKASFLANHGLVDNEFMNRLLDSMSFQRFIEERGPSYRHCDVFDDLYAEIQSQLGAELDQLEADVRHRSHFHHQHHHYNQHHHQAQLHHYVHSSSSDVHSASTNGSVVPGQSLVAAHVRAIAQKLFKYEFPHTQLPTTFTATGGQVKTLSSVINKSSNHLMGKSQVQSDVVGTKDAKNPLLSQPARSLSKIKLPTLDAFRRIHAEMFPLLDAAEMNRLITHSQQQNVTPLYFLSIFIRVNNNKKC